jgi:hypothetical protein
MRVTNTIEVIKKAQFEITFSEKRFYECLDIQAFQQSLEASCMAVPYWFMIMESVSRLTSNIYSSMCCLLFGLLSAGTVTERLYVL